MLISSYIGELLSILMKSIKIIDIVLCKQSPETLNSDSTLSL